MTATTERTRIDDGDHGEPTQFLDELAEVLSVRVADGAPMELAAVDRRGEGNSWETYLVRAEWVAGSEPMSADYAVKRQPISGIVGDYDVDREVALLHAAARIGLPVPGVAAHRSGRPGDPGFFVMQRLRGVVPMPHSVSRVIPGPADRDRLGRRVAREMAVLHGAAPSSLDLPQLPVPDGASTGRAENAVWRQTYLDVVDIRVPVLDLALAWLDHRADLVSGRVALVHNDFRVGNLMVDPTDGALVGILDWETAHFSDPVADLAWFFQRTSRGRSPLACKLITPDDFLDVYAEAAGWRPTPESIDWWAVQSLTKTAIGCLQAMAVYSRGERDDLRYANMAHSVSYSLGWLGQMLRDGQWGE